MALTVYQYAKCSTCRKALKWLDQHGLSYQSVAIVERPPSQAALRSAIERSGLPLRSFFNTSGESYREGGFKDRLPTMSEAEAVAALAADGKLIKRPLLVSEDQVLVGFDEKVWLQALTGR
jgi:arsenate reductase